MCLRLPRHTIVAFIFLQILRLCYCNEQPEEYCYGENRCTDSHHGSKFIFYDVNPQEGFNLRRDVYLRIAIFVTALKGYTLVLPPWYNLYHWKINGENLREAVPWREFFDVEAMRTFTPVVDLQDALTLLKNKEPLMDRVYVLSSFDNAFEGGHFVEKWNVLKNCNESPRFWGYDNFTIRNIECVQFQGGASKLKELLLLHASDRTVMFVNAEKAIHEHYNDLVFWTARKSMKFSKLLLETALNYIRIYLSDSYISVHWRRRDFTLSRKKDVPTITGTAEQINDAAKKNGIRKIFIATDAPFHEFDTLKEALENKQLSIFWFSAENSALNEGQRAIIDQIVCSRGMYFIGTHESTFSFRIQEEREILGYDSDLTFNRLCPDSGPCEKPSRWRIVEAK